MNSPEKRRLYVKEKRAKDSALLFRAVCDGDENKAAQLISNGAGVFWQNDGAQTLPVSVTNPKGDQYIGYTALELAAERGYTLLLSAQNLPGNREI